MKIGVRISNKSKTYLLLVASILLTLVIYFTAIIAFGMPFEIPQEIQTIVASMLLMFLAISLVFYFASQSRRSHDRMMEELALEHELTEKIEDLSKRLRHTESLLEMETHTFSITDALKEITILNRSGRGRITYFFKCRNNPDKTLDRIRLAVSHDGTLEEDSLKCTMNGKEVKPLDIQRLLIVDEKTREAAGRMCKNLKFAIYPEKSIEPSAKFEYSYSYEVNNLYLEIETKNKEYSQTLILHPTRLLRYVIEAPMGYVFDRDVRFMVIDRDEVEYIAEEKRVSEECSPILLNEGKTLVWDVYNPRIASLYRIYLGITKIKP